MIYILTAMNICSALWICQQLGKINIRTNFIVRNLRCKWNMPNLHLAGSLLIEKLLNYFPSMQIMHPKLLILYTNYIPLMFDRSVKVSRRIYRFPIVFECGFNNHNCALAWPIFGVFYNIFAKTKKTAILKAL